MGRRRSVRPRAQSIPRDQNDDLAHVLERTRLGLAERHIPSEADKRVLRGDVLDIAMARLELIIWSEIPASPVFFGHFWV
jgi:hypothetical protein